VLIFSLDYFTKNIDRTWRLFENLEAGMIGMNTGNSSAAETPFGGIKESGYGKESGKDVAVAEYMVRTEPSYKLVIATLTKQFVDHQDRHAHLVRPLLSNEHYSCGFVGIRQRGSVNSSYTFVFSYQIWIVPLHKPSMSSILLLTVVKFSYPSSLTTISSSIRTPPTLQ
jgi:hypothetical protein